MTKLHASLRKEYLFSTLDEKAADRNPLKQFSIWFDEAIAAEIEEPNAMVLSTADHEGNVSGRVVLLKGLEQDGFVFYTNYESRKGMQLASNPKAALTFLWFSIERQIRVEGSVVKTSRLDTEEYFNSRPADSRISACVSPQSRVIPGRPFLESLRTEFIAHGNGQPPRCPEHWGGYLLKPVMIEFWQGRAHRMHDRLRYRLDGENWILERLAP
ncbi:MAG: pyridoxamine 5'-phosphate oxidase [Bacteroidetes bacterium]|nr:pyridoxamine 5'-phosphate oxidase [Bacteroidota bacterium]